MSVGRGHLKNTLSVEVFPTTLNGEITWWGGGLPKAPGAQPRPKLSRETQQPKALPPLKKKKVTLL